MKTCIHQGIILLENGEFTGDIVFEDEKILALGENLVDMADYVVDVSGCYVFAGGIDDIHILVPLTAVLLRHQKQLPLVVRQQLLISSIRKKDSR